MDPLFLLPLKLVVIKDYECVLRLWYQIITFVNSWKLTDKKSPFLRNLNFSEESLQMGPQIDSDFIFYWFIYTYIFAFFQFFLLYH